MDDFTVGQSFMPSYQAIVPFTVSPFIRSGELDGPTFFRANFVSWWEEFVDFVPWVIDQKLSVVKTVDDIFGRRGIRTSTLGEVDYIQYFNGSVTVLVDKGRTQEEIKKGARESVSSLSLEFNQFVRKRITEAGFKIIGSNYPMGRLERGDPDVYISDFSLETYGGEIVVTDLEGNRISRVAAKRRKKTATGSGSISFSVYSVAFGAKRTSSSRFLQDIRRWVKSFFSRKRQVDFNIETVDLRDRGRITDVDLIRNILLLRSPDVVDNELPFGTFDVGLIKQMLGLAPEDDLPHPSSPRIHWADQHQVVVTGSLLWYGEEGGLSQYWVEGTEDEHWTNLLARNIQELIQGRNNPYVAVVVIEDVVLSNILEGAHLDVDSIIEEIIP